MENQNPNGLGSQIQGSMCSLSVPSEPPNVGDWFSSYEYDSPALGTIDGFTDSVSRESEVFVIQQNPKEKEQQIDEFQKTRCKEETNSNLLANNLQENQSLSEIPDSSYFLSQVSEAPDVKNWFSRYVYDSFVLDTNGDVKDTDHQESECDKEGFVMGESQKEQENLADIRNRLSSYAYKSFVLDTNEDVKDTLCQASECDKGVVMGECQKELDKNMAAFRETGCFSEADVGQEIYSSGFVNSCDSLGEDELDDKSSRKNLDSPDSSPLFTEPPDVKNWFLSYAYESPALGTSDQFGDSLHLKREEEKFVVEDSDRENEEKLVIIRKVKSRNEKVDDEKVQSNRFTKHNSYFGVREQGRVSKGVHGIGGKESRSPRSNLCSVKVVKESSEARTLQSNDTSASKDVKESNCNDEDSISKLEQDFSEEECSVSLIFNRISSSNRKKSPTKLFYRADFKKESMEDVNLVSPSSNSRSASQTKPARGSDDKENESKGSTENGFVATRKINGCARTENEDSSKRARGILLECPVNKGTVSPAGEKGPFVRRKALMETTNYQKCDSSEVTGKWRCPQRSKPNLGPPLKQLRLEQWIHRA